MSQNDDTSFGATHILETTLTTTIDSIQENDEDIIIIWFEPIMNTIDDAEKIKDELETVNNLVHYPIDIDSCITYIQLMKKKKIFLVTSGNNAYELIPSIVKLPQLDSIFIFPDNREEYNRLCDDYCKIVDIFNNYNELIRSIKDNIKYIDQQMEVVSFYEQHQIGTRDLSEQSAEFLWFQLFIDVIQRMSHDDKAKEEMLTVCRQYYWGKHQTLEVIDEFEQNYSNNECIRWYTRETFIYKLINMALRTEDIEQLYIFRYYIADLSKQLAQECKKIKTEEDKKIKLYRGTIINKKEAEKFKANVGKLIATNGYWSTSLNRSFACTFANKLRSRVDTLAVLFEIECNLKTQNNSVIVADISELSFFPTEQEFLLDAGSIFHIENIREEREDNIELTVIQMTTSEKGREIARNCIEEQEREMIYESPKIMLGILLKRLGKFDKSLQYYQQLLKSPGGENDPHIHYRIGIALRYKSEYDLALKHFNKALDLIEKSHTPERVYLALILHNKGQIYG